MYNINELKVYALTTVLSSNIPDNDKAQLLEVIQVSDKPRLMAFLNKGQTYFGPMNESVEKTISDEFDSNTKLIESIDNFIFTLDLLQEVDITTRHWDLNPSTQDDKITSLSSKYLTAKKTEYTDWFTGDRHSNLTAKLTDAGEHALQGIGAAVLATIVLTIGYKLFKRYVTEKGRVCGRLKGNDKAKCEAKVTVEGLNQAVSKMNALKNSKCPKSKNPSECKQKIDAKIKKYQEKIAKYKSAI
jgi:hypothetical protein